MADEWYAVRCVFRWAGSAGQPYEERITLWRAAGLDNAIALAEAEAQEYAENTGVTYLGLAQAYAIGEKELTPGSEVFSLLRESELPPEKYLDRFFDTGDEHRTGKSEFAGRVAALHRGGRACGYLFVGPASLLEFLRSGDDGTWYYSDRADPDDYDTTAELASGEIDWYGTAYSARWLPDGEAREVRAFFDTGRPKVRSDTGP
ncbi:hypothetical protein ABJI51_07180 [Amycolatopsis sp. NEAU-NG30]|uniref:DUF4240 domain-containing protein n=1 Tax=Amycolatopsis melonis TaxID=3156488 RepID=A0ABV0LBW7_9PSEU